MINPADIELIEDEPLTRLAIHDAGAFEILYNRYFPRIYKYVIYRVTDFQIADDLVSDIFERIFVNLEKFKPQKGLFCAWAFSIARHVIIDYFRRKKWKQWISLENISHAYDAEMNIENVTLKNHQEQLLLSSLACLSSREVDVIGLKFSSALNNRQIAQIPRLSESNVGVILYRALKKLRIVMTSQEESDD